MRLLGKWVLISLLLLSPTLSIDVSQAQTNESEIQEKVEAVLSSRHPSETDFWWRSLGPSAPQILIKMYQEKTSTYHKMRLIDGLRAFKDHPDAVQFLLKELGEQKQSAIRKNLIESVIAQNSPGALQAVEPFLSDEDPQVRFVTARALKRLNTSEAKSMLSLYQQNEKQSWIVKRLNKEPVPVASLSPAASSLDTEKSQFSGTWQGYWLYDHAGQMLTIPAEYSVAWADRKLADLKVTLKLDDKKTEVIKFTLKSESTELKQLKMVAVLSESQTKWLSDLKNKIKNISPSEELTVQLFPTKNGYRNLSIQNQSQILFSGLSAAP